MRKLILTAVLLLTVLAFSTAANKRVTVAQVTDAVTLTDDVDYIITSATPFGEGGSIDIVNTEHATVILNAVKPSAAIKLLANYVKINGQKAVNNTNCQVKLYNLGAIILPYGNSIKPLTVYSEQDFGGTSVNGFGLDNTGGYMNTLTSAQLNNSIRSFKLKRGYMVTFSTLPGGRGYSRCFIAADQDLEVASLPTVLDQKISSYRVFKWYDAGKKQLANSAGDKNALDALNVQSTYDWAQGNSNLLPDYEWVPNHIYEDWPSSAAIGGTSQSPHTKNNNEPRNSADDHPQDLATILGNWENMMRTGLRLCSPASWDGSDYWNATGFLAEFLDSIDARGWRCDIIDLHCYWPENNFSNIKNWVDKYKRPVWISEWCWGASWSSNGAFASGVTEAQVKSALQRICGNLNNWNYVERYYYWNGERDPSRLYKDGKLTPAGEYYASMNSGVGYNGKYDFVPTSPRQYAPSAFSVSRADGTATIKWYDANGEYNQLMQLERKLPGGQWEALGDIAQKEAAANYTYKDENAPKGAIYRLHLIDLNGNSYYTNNDMGAGDAITVDGETRYAGGNLLTNGDFDLGMYDWTSGSGSALAAPYFQAVSAGSIDGGSYLQAYGSSAINNAASVKKYVAIQPNTDYVFRCASCNGGSYQQVNLCTSTSSNGQKAVGMKNSANWQMQSATFNSGNNSYALVTFYTLQSKAQFDKVEIRQLFKTREEAVADGVEKMKARAQAVIGYNATQELAALNSELESRMAAISGTGDDALRDAETAINELLQAIADHKAIDSMTTVTSALAKTGATLPDELNRLWAVAPDNYTAQLFTERRKDMQQALDEFLTYTDAEKQPQSPSFANNKSTGWEVKTGTHKGGDQTSYTKLGKTCWNAWWSGLSASEGEKKSMEIRQTVDNLPEGLYALECKATTEHYCLSDQHGFITTDGETMSTPLLEADHLDLPTIGNVWQTLTTPPVYVSSGGSVTIGFAGTKQGATDNLWHRYGSYADSDKREGWWCATDFRLLYHPMRKISTGQEQWGTICLPYAFTIPQGIKFYQIAGILKDHSKICIEEVSEIPAGKPVIFQAETGGQTVTLYEYGQKATAASSYKDENNLNGFFETVARAPSNSYILVRDTWYKVGSDRPTITSYSAIIRSLNGMTELDSWSGLTMPIVDEDYQTGINSAGVDGRGETGTSYTLGGRQASSQRGIVIEVNGRETKKVIRK